VTYITIVPERMSDRALISFVWERVSCLDPRDLNYDPTHLRSHALQARKALVELRERDAEKTLFSSHQEDAASKSAEAWDHLRSIS
jgi:hypothetical protein